MLLLELSRRRFEELFGSLSELQRVNHYYKVRKKAASSARHLRTVA